VCVFFFFFFFWGGGSAVACTAQFVALFLSAIAELLMLCYSVSRFIVEEINAQVLAALYA